MVQSVSKTNSLQESNSSFLSFLVAPLAEQDHRKLNILESRHSSKQVEGLEYEADVLQPQLGEEGV